MIRANDKVLLSVDADVVQQLPAPAFDDPQTVSEFQVPFTCILSPKAFDMATIVDSILAKIQDEKLQPAQPIEAHPIRSN